MPWEGSRVNQKAITSAFSPPTFPFPSLPFFPILSFAFPFSFSLLSLVPSSHCPFIRPFSSYFRSWVFFTPFFTILAGGPPRNFFSWTFRIPLPLPGFRPYFSKKNTFPTLLEEKSEFQATPPSLFISFSLAFTKHLFGTPSWPPSSPYDFFKNPCFLLNRLILYLFSLYF